MSCTPGSIVCAPQRARTVALLLLAAAAAAAEVAAPAVPVAEYDDVLGGTPVHWVDWGCAGTSEPRDAELIAEEQDSLRRFLHSPEMKARMVELTRLGAGREVELVRERLAEAQVHYRRDEVTTACPRAGQRLHDEVPLPMWAWGIPMVIRESTQVLLFDDRDPAQRAWVGEQGRDGERLTIAYCTAWTSGEDRDTYWKAHPGVPMHPVATDQLAAFYGVSLYPARIRFGAETMDIEQGIGP